MITILNTHRTRTLACVAVALMAIVASGCRHVATGKLNISNDLSGIGRDNTFLDGYLSDPGEPWPPAGMVNIFVRGDDFGRPPSYGLNGYLYLVRTNAACPQSEGAPEGFLLADVTIVGVITITNGTANQFVTMADTPANRQARWALIEVPELPNTGGLHLAYRCGTVAWM